MSLFDEVEERVKQRAYEIWQREGCPEGREADHWALAKEEIAIEDNQNQALLPNPSEGGDDTVVHPEPVEPLLAAESLGEEVGGRIGTRAMIEHQLANGNLGREMQYVAVPEEVVLPICERQQPMALERSAFRAENVAGIGITIAEEFAVMPA